MRLLLIIMTIFLIRGELYSQQYDSIIYVKVQINGVSLGSTKKVVISKIGKPQKITKYKNGSNDDHWFEYHYDHSILEILNDGSLYGFELKSSAFVLQYGECKVKVGDPVDALAKYFRGSFKAFKI